MLGKSRTALYLLLGNSEKRRNRDGKDKMGTQNEGFSFINLKTKRERKGGGLGRWIKQMREY